MLKADETRKVLPMHALQNSALEQLAQLVMQGWQRLLASVYLPEGQGTERTKANKVTKIPSCKNLELMDLFY